MGGKSLVLLTSSPSSLQKLAVVGIILTLAATVPSGVVPSFAQSSLQQTLPTRSNLTTQSGINATYGQTTASSAIVQGGGGGGMPDGNLLGHVKSLGKASDTSPPQVANASTASQSPQANYDEQLGITFAQSFTSLQYNVTAVEQSDSYGYGPAYLLNGLSDQGYWYQVGLSWHWPYLSGGYVSSFSLNYEVFNSSGQSVFPSKGGGLLSYSGPINQGDLVLLSMYYLSGKVIMYSKDWNTGATASESYSSEGATSFIGLSGRAADSNGFFTGLMTEQYHVSPYYGTEARVIYSNHGVALSSAIMWIDEYNVNTSQVLFGQSSSQVYYNSNPSQFQSFSSNGAFEASNAYEFATGSESLIGITLSYSIQGGGVGYSPPELSYISIGVKQSTTLTLQPTTYYMDNGTVWSVANLLGGSTSNERWVTNQTTQELVTSPQTIELAYVHEFSVTIGSSPSGAGTTTPAGTAWYSAQSEITITAMPIGNEDFFDGWNSTTSLISFGSAKSTSTNATISGAGSIYANFAKMLVTVSTDSAQVTQGASTSLATTVLGGPTGSSATLSIVGLPQGASAHFASQDVSLIPSGLSDDLNISASLATPPGRYQVTITVTSSAGSVSTQLELTVREAVPLTLAYSISDGAAGSSSPPALNFTYNGVNRVEPIGSGEAQLFYADYGSAWQVQSTLPGSTSSERWIMNQTNSGNATGPLNMTLVYFHQYYISFEFQQSPGGAGDMHASPIVTFRSLGSQSAINASASGGEGVWVDAGSTYSYAETIGASAQQRWELTASGGGSGEATGPNTVDPLYYLQYFVEVSLQVAGGGTPSGTIDYQSGGSVTTTALDVLNGTGIWADSGSRWTAPTLLNSSSQSAERWIVLTTSSSQGSITSSEQVRLVYQHQYFVAVAKNVQSAGSLNVSSGWFNAGRVLAISANASPGWQFSGWQGDPTLAGSNSSSVAFPVSAPMNATANFYAGVDISTGPNGEVTYTYGTTTGTLGADSSRTIYVPPGTNVSFHASPSSPSFLYALSGWTVAGNGSIGASSPSISLDVSSPTTVVASFTYNYTNLAIIAAVLVALVFLAGMFLRKRH